MSAFSVGLKTHAKRLVALTAALFTGAAGIAIGASSANAVTDTPLTDPGRIRIQKAVEGTGSAGNTSGDITDLSGVKFRVDYYKGLYNSQADLKGKTPNASAQWSTMSAAQWKAAGASDADAAKLAGSFSIGSTAPDAGTIKVDGKSAADWPYKNGSKVNTFPLGTVTVTEVGAPAGLVPNYSLVPASTSMEPMFQVVDDGSHNMAKINVISKWNNNAANANGAANSMSVVVPDSPMRGSVQVIKADDETNASDPQGDADLAGAQYTIVNKSKSTVSIKSDVPGLITTGKKAHDETYGSLKESFYDYAPGDKIMTITTAKTDAGYVAKTADKALPYGTYEISETKAPKGYHLKTWDKTFSIRKDGQVVSYTKAKNGVDDKAADVADEGWNRNNVQRGGVQIGKLDRETKNYSELGDAKLDGAVFSITNSSAHNVLVPAKGKSYAPGQVVKSITVKYQDILDTAGKSTGKKGYVAYTGIDDLPYGTYTIKETSAGVGYLYDTTAKNWKATVSIGYTKNGVDFHTIDYASGADDHQYANLTDPAKDAAKMPQNQVQREDFNFIKKDEDSMERMGKIAWQVTSKTTGETHIFVSDVNGRLDTKSCDAKFNADNDNTCHAHNINTDANDPDSPITNGGMAKDAKTGKYTVKDTSKLNSDAGMWFTGIGPKSQGAPKLVWDKDAKGYNVTVSGVTSHATVNNALRALPYDEYTIQELATPGSNDGHRLVSLTFTAHDFTRNSDNTINGDGNGIDFNYGTIDDKTMGASTELEYDGKTTDVDPNTGLPGSKTVPAVKSVTVSDSMSYWGLTVGKYTAKGELYVLNDKGKIDDGAKPVATATKAFNVVNPVTGTVVVPFTFDSSALGGKTVVAYESILDANGNELTNHKDASDVDQQVHFALIGTQAKGAIDDEQNAYKNPIVITDTVSYSGLTKGKEYNVTGTLHARKTDAKTGKVTDGGVIKDKDGKDVTVKSTFTATDTKGTVDVKFSFNTPVDKNGKTTLAGTDVVAFETLDYNGEQTAVHADISDTGQDIHFPDVHTNASDKADGDQEIAAKTDQTIEDKVSYTNLTVGKTYNVSGTLHIKNIDEKTGKVTDGGVLNGADGKPITASKDFTPTAKDGFVTLEFKVDASALAGKTIVAFEDVTRSKVELVPHADINDVPQTITIPSIGTNLVDSKSKAQQVQIKDHKDTQALIDAKNKADADGSNKAKDDGNDANGADSNDDANDDANGSDTDNSDAKPSVDDKLSGTAITDGDSTGMSLDDALAKYGEVTVNGQRVNADLAHGNAFKVAFDKDGKLAVDIKFSPSVAVEGSPYTLSHENITDKTGKVTGIKFDMKNSKGAVVKEWAFATDGGTPVTPYDPNAPVDPDDPDDPNNPDDPAKPDDDPLVKVDLTDTVNYKNVVVGKEYTLKGALHLQNRDKDGNITDGGVLKDKDGKEVTATGKFTPTKTSGSTPIQFTFEVKESVIAGKSVVAFEQLFHGDIDVADHADIKDEGQTVDFVDIGTQALDSVTGKHVANQSKDGKTTIVDTVAYVNLRVGQEYTMTGTLHVQKTDKDGKVTDGGVFKDKDGKAVTASVKFKPETPSGTVDITFTFTTPDNFQGSTLVAFESLAANGTDIADHADITDTPQSVHWVKIGTTLQGKDNSKTVKAGSKVELVDHVQYENLVPGEKYTMVGQLMTEDGKTFGDQFKVTFTPDKASGTVDVPFTVDTSKLPDGAKLVAFEYLHSGDTADGAQIASHEDLKDQGQTVTVSNPVVPPAQPNGGQGESKTPISLQTGIRNANWIVLAFVAAALAAIAIAERKTRLARK